MQGVSHRKLTKLMLPGLQLPDETVGKIHDRMDRATDAQIAINKLMGGSKSPNVPFLSRTGHRTHTHNIPGTLATGYMYGGPQGVAVSAAHGVQDILSDMLVKLYGVEGRNLIESVYLYMNRDPAKQRRGSGRSRNRNNNRVSLF